MSGGGGATSVLWRGGKLEGESVLKHYRRPQSGEEEEEEEGIWFQFKNNVSFRTQ